MEQDAAQYIGPIAYRVAQACIPHFYQKLARFDFIQNHILENEWGPGTIDDVGFCRDLFLGYHDASMSVNAHSSRINFRAKFDFERCGNGDLLSFKYSAHSPQIRDIELLGLMDV